MFLRGQYSYTGDSTTRLVPAPNLENDPTSCCRGNPSFTNESYAIADIRLGLISSDGGWQVDLFVSNVTDERAQIDQGNNFAYNWGRTGEYEHVQPVYTVRPREYGIRFTTRWY